MLMDFHFNFKKINEVKNDVLSFCEFKHVDDHVQGLQQKYKELPQVQLLLLIYYLYVNDKDMTKKIIDRFLFEIIGLHIEERLENVLLEHPAQILVRDNYQFRQLMHQINEGLAHDELQYDSMLQKELRDAMYAIGQLYNHYHVKEKLIFPVLERYGHHMFTRELWRENDRIRGLYQGAKRMIDRVAKSKLENALLTFEHFSDAFMSMIFQEEKFMFPIALTLFSEEEWEQIALESTAYRYEMVDVIKEETRYWHVLSTENRERKIEAKIQTFANEQKVANVSLAVGDEGDIEAGMAGVQREKSKWIDEAAWKTENIPFGGGFLTIEEANLILNNLPVEITFVDKNSIFKYFNQVTNAEDMMLIRTPLSIGRNVADCHPPKSLKKVMTLVRDLKTKRRTSESMWFKKGKAYVHITYKALFNDEDEFLGILEYVQDISSFIDLPKETKRELSPLRE